MEASDVPSSPAGCVSPCLRNDSIETFLIQHYLGHNFALTKG